MKKQKNNKTAVVLVYGYGVVPPSDNEHVRAEVSRMAEMWNRLVALDRECDQALHELMMKKPEYAAAHATLDNAWNEYRIALEKRNAERARTRRKKTSLDDVLRDAVKARNAARKETWVQAKQWRGENKELVANINTGRYDGRKKIRQTSGLYWGNYNEIVNRYEAACKACLKKGRKTQYKDREGKSGCLAVQIQRTRTGLGAAPAEIVGGKLPALRIEPIDPAAWSKGTTARTRECLTWCEMRIDRAGHVARFPVWLHRPLPENGRIKMARLSWHQKGEKVIGRLSLTVLIPPEEFAGQNASRSACGIDLGWRLNRSGGLQVAVAMGTDGKIKRFELSREWMKGMDQVERLGSHIDEGLMEVAKEVTAIGNDAPEPIRGAVSKWRPGLGAKYIDAQGLHDAVRVLNFKVPAAVLHWYKRYRHLSVWRDNLRSKLIGRRREIYRLAAREIAQSYRIIGIEDMDLSKMAKTKKSDFGDNELFAAARVQRVRAAVHSLREEIEHQAVKHGAQIVYSTAYTTCRCRVCGQITRQHDRSMLVWVCEHCGATWDQDINAAGNLMAAASGASADVTGVVGDEKSTDNSLVLGQKKDLSKIGHQLSENVVV